MSTKYRAIITRANGETEDWGFLDLRVIDGTLFLRITEEMSVGGYDTIFAAGQWLSVEDIAEES